MIITIQSDAEILACYPVLKTLRPHLDESSFLTTVRNMYTEGYQLAAITEHDTIMAVAGYKVSSNFAFGKKLYIEDLASSEAARSKGFGGQLLNYLEQKAREQNCEVIHLDSGTQRHRAHKFYFMHNFEIFAYDFVKRL